MGLGNSWSIFSKSDLHQFLREQKQALDAAYADLNGVMSLIENRYQIMNSLDNRDPTGRKRRQEIYEEIQRLKQDKRNIQETIAHHKSAIEDIKRALNTPR